mgnify:FL=1
MGSIIVSKIKIAEKIAAIKYIYGRIGLKGPISPPSFSLVMAEKSRS